MTEADGVTLDTGDAGFAHVEGERKLGRLKVLLVRSNAELLPFDPPSTGKIAVKVINDYGDEVMKVYDVA